MRIKAKAFVSTLIISFLAMTPVLASPSVSIEKNYSNGEIKLNLNEEESRHYAVIMLKGATKPQELFGKIESGNIVTEGNITRYNPMSFLKYQNEFESNNGPVIEVTESGNYTIYISSKNNDEIMAYPIYAVSKDDYKRAIDEVNGQINNRDEFYNKISENKEKLGFDLPLTSGQSLKDVSDLMFNEKNGTLLDAAEYHRNMDLYKSCIALDILNKGTISEEAAAIIEELLQSDENLKEYYGKYITSNDKKTEMNNRLINKGIRSTEDLKNKIRDAVILTIVHHPDGYMNIKSVFERYKTELELSSVSSDASVYKSLVGDYASVEEMMKKYKSLTTSGGGSSGGSGGSSSGKSISSGFGSSNGAVITPVRENGAILMPFDDLDTVTWAYEAISALADAKIISGKSETKFAPRDKIKREEFVKMIVAAMGEEPLQYTDIFKDVDENAWYAGYVLKAYRLSIINGIGNDLFGSGENITRQDMAVIIYNAMIKSGITLETQELEFSDKHLISDYAKNAVSALTKAGVINGLSDNTFNPAGEATRAEAAKMIYGMYSIIGK